MKISNRNDFVNININSRFSYSEEKLKNLKFKKLIIYPDKAYIDSISLTKNQLLILKLIYTQKIISLYHLQSLSGLNKSILKKNLIKLTKNSLIQNKSNTSNSIYAIDYSGSYYIQSKFKKKSSPKYINDSSDVLNILSFNQLVINIFKSKLKTIKSITIFDRSKKDSLKFTGKITINIKNVDTPFLFMVIRRNIVIPDYFNNIKNELVLFSKNKWEDSYQIKPVIVIMGEDDKHNIEISSTLRDIYNNNIEKILNIKYTNDLIVDMLPLNYMFNNFDDDFSVKAINAQFLK